MGLVVAVIAPGAMGAAVGKTTDRSWRQSFDLHHRAKFFEARHALPTPA